MSGGGGSGRDEVDWTGGAGAESSHRHPIRCGINHHGAVEAGAHQEGAPLHKFQPELTAHGYSVA